MPIHYTLRLNICCYKVFHFFVMLLLSQLARLGRCGLFSCMVYAFEVEQHEYERTVCIAKRTPCLFAAMYLTRTVCIAKQFTYTLLQLRVSPACQRHSQACDPGDPAVQAHRVCSPDQPEHGQRLGHPALHCWHLHEAEGGQVPHHEGPQQGQHLPFTVCRFTSTFPF